MYKDTNREDEALHSSDRILVVNVLHLELMINNFDVMLVSNLLNFSVSFGIFPSHIRKYLLKNVKIHLFKIQTTINFLLETFLLKNPT